MKKIIPFLFVIFLFASSSSYALDFIKLGDSHDDGFWGTPDSIIPNFPSTIQYLAERGNFQTNPINTLHVTDADVQQALAGGFGPFNALLFSENIEDLTPQTYQLINNYVSGGGCVVVTSSHEDETEFLNSSFGYNLSVDAVQDAVDTFAIQPGANRTQFGGGPGTLVAASLTVAFGNTPGTTIYDGATGVAVFTDQFGQGTVVAIGWDYCCDPPDEPGPILDWYEVVNRAFDQCTEPVVLLPIPTLSEWGLIAMAGVLGIVGFMVIRRRKVTA